MKLPPRYEPETLPDGSLNPADKGVAAFLAEIEKAFGIRKPAPVSRICFLATHLGLVS